MPRSSASLSWRRNSCRLKVDVIVTGGSQATGPAKKATSTIPIVMAQDNDPVGSGFVASLAQPGGNITGLANLNSELSGKQLEVLKESFPKLSRVAILSDMSEPGSQQPVKETERAAKALGVEPHYLDIRALKDFDGALISARAKKRRRAAGATERAVQCPSQTTGRAGGKA